MVKVTVLEPLHVEATGTTYTKGRNYEVSQALFEKHKDRHFKEVTEAVQPKKQQVKK